MCCHCCVPRNFRSHRGTDTHRFFLALNYALFTYAQNCDHMHTRTQTHTHTHINVHRTKRSTSTNTHTPIPARTHTSTRAHIQTHIHAHVSAHSHAIVKSCCISTTCFPHKSARAIFLFYVSRNRACETRVPTSSCYARCEGH